MSHFGIQKYSEIVWVDGVLEFLKIHIPKAMLPITMFRDNKYAMHIADNPVLHERTKHLNKDCHYVREHVENGILSTAFVRSSLQLDEIMTKGLSKQQHKFQWGKLGLIPYIQVQLEEGMKKHVINFTKTAVPGSLLYGCIHCNIFLATTVCFSYSCHVVMCKVVQMRWH